ncbi:hypothetical protein KKE92_03865 [Candidatus Micrarchaeota archaeon]|nr:hypothetical protein [Candidatus Micrarchaeota archaeon]MBU1681357.1 hypothetical protein [Candidatus Micrarchaeota archaeon]
MKITTEGSSLMALKDYNTSHFFGGFIFLAVGIVALLAFLPSGEILPIAFTGIFVLAGLGILASTKLVNITLNKGTSKARFSLWSIIKQEAREVSLQTITGITLEKEHISSRRSTRRQFIINFVLEGGEALPFEFGSLSGGMDILTNPEEGIRNKAKEVAAFLNVPLKEIGPPSAAETLSAVKDVIMSKMEKHKQ